MLKKELEEENKGLRRQLRDHSLEEDLLIREIKILKSYGVGGHLSAMVIALEKITEAMSHAIQSINSRR